MINIPEAKDKLRQEMRQKLADLSPIHHGQWSQEICDHLLALPAIKKSQSIISFFPTKQEVNLQPFFLQVLQSARKFALPRMNLQTQMLDFCLVNDLGNLVANKLQILEPPADSPVMPISKSTVILVPGLAFDTKGGRLGRGLGYFDRTLGSFKLHLIGVCFDLQIVKKVPQEKHDRKMEIVVTEKQTYF